jgi:hypothetical protein
VFQTKKEVCMVRKLSLAACVLLVGALSGFSQNARIGSMAGVGNVSDISWVLGNPAYMNSYKDAVQGTIDNAASNNLRSVIGVKGLGDMWSLGLTYQNNQALAAPALASMLTLLGTTPTLPAATVTPVPHLLGGMNLGAAKLGVDLFWERALYNSSDETQAGPSPVPKVTTKITGTYTNMGLAAGLVMEAGLPIAAHLGASLPSINGDNLVDQNDGNSTETKVTSDFSLALNVGADVTPKIGDMDWKSGINYAVVTYGRGKTVGTVKTPTNTTETTTQSGSHNSLHDWTLFTGLSQKLQAQNVLLSGIITGDLTMARSRPDVITVLLYDPGMVTTNALSLLAQAATEKEWDHLKHLDAIQARAGLQYGVTVNITHEAGDTTDYLHTARLQNYANRSGFGLTLGMGFTKSMFQFDLQVSPTAILNAFKYVNGLNAGQDLVRASVAVDFGKKSTAPAQESTGSPAPTF